MSSTPSPQWTDYRAQLARVTAHIHDPLAEPLDLNRLAVVADLSPFHWHRIYHALMGETVMATVRRLRLHQASGYLAQTAMTVTEIARRCNASPSAARPAPCCVTAAPIRTCAMPTSGFMAAG